jgi:hypothetical protein
LDIDAMVQELVKAICSVLLDFGEIPAEGATDGNLPAFFTVWMGSFFAISDMECPCPSGQQRR